MKFNNWTIQPNDWHNFKESQKPKPREPAIDKLVSEIVGKPILMTDPRLINLIVKWKREKNDELTPDNFLQNSAHIEELKRTLC